MARYYVQKDGEWNIFSTIIDDFLFDEFICLDALKARLLYERFKELTEDMDSLLTDKPSVNVMDYEEAMERRREQTEPQTEGVWNAGYKTGYDKGYKDAQKVKDSQVLVKDLVDGEFNPYDEECMRCKHLKLKCEFIPTYCKFESRDEPNSSENPNNSKVSEIPTGSEKPNNCTDCECTDDCTECKEAEHGCKDEPQTERRE